MLIQLADDEYHVLMIYAVFTKCVNLQHWMLSLNETVERTPVHVFYLGSETQFLDELETLDKPVSDPENLEFTCCRDARDLISHLYAFETPQKDLNIVIFGLLRHLEGSYGPETPECVLRHWSAVLNTGVPYLQFGDTAKSDLVDTLLSKTKLESNELQTSYRHKVLNK